MAVQNSTVLAKCWLEGTNDFQQRIPNPSIEGFDAAIKELFEPYNHDLFNQFANMLVGMMGTYVESKLFENPLRELKKPATEWGNTERHVAVKYLKAHSYKADDETLLKLEKPEFREWFYSVNQNRRYEFSWSKYELARVFSDGDSYGYDDLLAATLDQMRSSDNYDEMNTMLQVFAHANKHMSLYKTQISVPTTKVDAQDMLVKIKADAGKLQFPSMRYNQIDVPVYETPQTLVLWVTPEVDAYLDVMALAELFHVERAEVNFRKIIIPEFPIPNVYAALTSEDFVYARDVWYGIEPPFYNPSNRTYKYYLFHDQMIGVNPAANCILYTTDEGTGIPTVEQEYTGIVFDDSRTIIEPGGTLQLKLYANGSITGDSSGEFSVQPVTGICTVEGIAGLDGTPAAPVLNSRTYVDEYMVLHMQKSGLTEGQRIKVTCESVYVNPSGETQAIEPAEITITIVRPGTVRQGGKDDFVERNPNLVYTPDDDFSTEES